MVCVLEGGVEYVAFRDYMEPWLTDVQRTATEAVAGQDSDGDNFSGLGKQMDFFLEAWGGWSMSSRSNLYLIEFLE